jgi:hypothetical protein
MEAAMNVLIVYFSRTGTTEEVAGVLAQKLGAELHAIRPRADYAGGGGFFRGIWQSLRRGAPEITHGQDPKAYDLVVLGSPIWAGRLSGPMRAYLKRNAKQLPAVAAFCVSGSGAAYADAFEEIVALGGPTPSPTVCLAERDVRSEVLEAKLEPFLRALPPVRRAAA